MAVVNVTPDSFSDGGHWFAPDAAVQHGLRLIAEGADIVDVGGESTRPGAPRTAMIEELRRVLPVIHQLTAAGAVVSVDTMRAEVAAAAIEAGAVIVNDVSGGLADPQMLSTVADAEVAYVATHWRGHSAHMQDRAHYQNVASEVADELVGRVAEILSSGIAADRLVLDPGIGYAKTADQNWALIAGISHVSRLGYPLLIGASRKGFLGQLLTDASGSPRPASQRDDATTALTTVLAGQGIWAFRTHTAGKHRDSIAVALRLLGLVP